MWSTLASRDKGKMTPNRALRIMTRQFFGLSKLWHVTAVNAKDIIAERHRTVKHRRNPSKD
jgi:hypothetical protein